MLPGGLASRFSCAARKYIVVEAATHLCASQISRGAQRFARSGFAVSLDLENGSSDAKRRAFAAKDVLGTARSTPAIGFRFLAAKPGRPPQNPAAPASSRVSGGYVSRLTFCNSHTSHTYSCTASPACVRRIQHSPQPAVSARPRACPPRRRSAPSSRPSRPRTRSSSARSSRRGARLRDPCAPEFDSVSDSSGFQGPRALRKPRVGAITVLGVVGRETLASGVTH